MENTAGIKRVLIIPNVTKKATLEYTEKLKFFFADKGIKTEVVYDLKNNPRTICGGFDMAVVLGGDGSVLMAVSFFERRDIPIIGINFGHFGYLTECEPRDGFETIEKVLRGEYIMDERMMLSCKLYNKDGEYTEYTALNEAVIYRGSLMHILDISLSINEKPIAEFLCDGIIITTPTGSTAYNLSAGGPVLVPTSENIAITPICQRNPSCSSIVTSGGDSICTLVDKDSFLCIDGQKQIPLERGARLEFSKSPYKTKIIKVSNGSFYTALQKKLSKENE